MTPAPPSSSGASSIWRRNDQPIVGYLAFGGVGSRGYSLSEGDSGLRVSFFSGSVYIPPHEMGVDVDNDFRPMYVIVEGKQQSLP
jgi:hypothetical protein